MKKLLFSNYKEWLSDCKEIIPNEHKTNLYPFATAGLFLKFFLIPFITINQYYTK